MKVTLFSRLKIIWEEIYYIFGTKKANNIKK